LIFVHHCLGISRQSFKRYLL